MNVKKIALIALFLSISAFAHKTHSNDQLNFYRKKFDAEKAFTELTKIAQSPEMHTWNAKQAQLNNSDPDLTKRDTLSVPCHIKKLAKEAQIAAGIPEDRQVPVFYAPEWLDYTANAAATAGRIMITSDFTKLPITMQRYILYHEAIHIKYNDGAIGTNLEKENLSDPVNQLIFSVLQKHYKEGQKIDRYEICDLFIEHREHRADTESAYNIGCWCCIAKISQSRQKHPKHAGYLSDQEFEIIAAQLLHDRKKLCDHHASKIKTNAKFKNKILACHPLIAAAYAAEHSWLNRSKRVVQNNIALAQTGRKTLAHAATSMVKQMAQPRAGLPNKLLTINRLAL